MTADSVRKPSENFGAVDADQKLKGFANEIGPFLKTAATWRVNDAFEQWGAIDKDAWTEAVRLRREALAAIKAKAHAERAATQPQDPLRDFGTEIGPFLKSMASWRFTEAFDEWGNAVLREKVKPAPLFDAKAERPDPLYAFYVNLGSFLKTASLWRFTEAWANWGRAAPSPLMGHNSGSKPVVDMDLLISAYRRLDRPWVKPGA